ncbi:unnamed protein product, partial [Heterosigma akashiwo]
RVVGVHQCCPPVLLAALAEGHQAGPHHKVHKVALALGEVAPRVAVAQRRDGHAPPAFGVALPPELLRDQPRPARVQRPGLGGVPHVGALQGHLGQQQPPAGLLEVRAAPRP